MTNRRAFIKQFSAGSLGLGLLIPFNGVEFNPWMLSASAHLPRSSPEAQGIASADIQSFLKAIQDSGIEFHSLMIVRHGHVIAEGWWSPYAPDFKQQLYSLSKSFTSTAIGLCVDDQLITVEDPVIQFFPNDLPDEVSDNLKTLKIKHLLTMSVGHDKDSIRIIEKSPQGVPWARTFLNLPVVFEPGSRFLYNSGASFMLCAIVQRVTGGTAHDLLVERIFKPLQITGTTWATNPDGINMGASHLRVKTEDIAKFSQLYIQKGVWEGKQIIGGDYVEAATRKEINNGNNDSSWGYGYGYQFWMNPPGGFRSDGAFGQYGMVFPDKDTIVVITSQSFDTRHTMQLVWDEFFPKIGDAALPENKQQNQTLLKALAALKYDPPMLNAQSPLATSINGKVFALEVNPYKIKAVSFSFGRESCVFTAFGDGTPDIKVTCGINRYITEGNRKPGPDTLFSTLRIDFDSVLAASAGWKDDQTLELTWRAIETTHGDKLNCIFDGNQVTISFLNSIAEGQQQPDDRTPVTGSAQA